MTQLAPVAVGLQVAGEFIKGSGQAASYRYQEDKAQRLALSARTAADQTDAQFRNELNITLGNINAIRAAANASPDSPTAIAISEGEREASERQRRIKTGSLRAQAAQYDSDARFFGSAANYALGIGALNAVTKGISGLAGLRA